MMVNLRQAPLLDRDLDRELFVAPADYERLLWTAGEGMNVLILGDRGQGKTTVLRQLQLSLRTKGTRPVVFVDLASAETLADALRLVVAGVAEAHRQILSWMPVPQRLNESEREHSIRVSLDQLSSLGSCALMVDNAQAQDVAFPLFGVYRDRIWEMPHQWVVTANSSERRWFLRPPADAFWEDATEIDYSEAAARDILARRLDSRPPWLAPIVENAGTNPRRLIRAASAAVRNDGKPDEVLDLWGAWRGKLSGLDHRSSMLMTELSARQPVSASDPDLRKTLGWARTSLLRTLEMLEAEGLVESWAEPDGSGRPKRLFATTEPGRPRRG